MPLHNLMIFLAAYLLATASPGPGIAALLARVLSNGRHGIVAFIAGYVVGDLVWFLAAATGMAAVAQKAHGLFVVFKYAGAAYLVYLAFRAATAPAEPVRIQDDASVQPQPQLFLASLTLTLSNPKVMIFFLALLPTLINVSALRPSDILEVAGATAVILTSVLASHTLLAIRARRLFQSVRAVSWLNRGTGAVMLGAAVVVATRQN